jgi:hypothetical protein
MKEIIGQFDHNVLTFFVNGKRVDVPSVDPRTTLAAFLRENCIYNKVGQIINFANFSPSEFAWHQNWLQ